MPLGILTMTQPTVKKILQEIAISMMEIDERFYYRKLVNDTWVIQLKERIQRGDELEFLQVVAKDYQNLQTNLDQHYFILDGYHRWLAYRQLGKDKLRVQVISGEEREILLYSLVAVNRKSEERYHPEENFQRGAKLLQDSEWKKWSNRALARAIQVDHKTIGRWRVQFQDPSDKPPSSFDRFVMVDLPQLKRMYWQSVEPEQETDREQGWGSQKRKNKEESQQVRIKAIPRKNPIVDELARQVPERLENIFQLRTQLIEIASSLETIAFWFEQLPSDLSRYLRGTHQALIWLDRSLMVDSLNRVITNIRQNTPYIVCPVCGDEPIVSPNCYCCHGYGFLTHTQWQSLNIELQEIARAYASFEENKEIEEE